MTFWTARRVRREDGEFFAFCAGHVAGICYEDFWLLSSMIAFMN
jgi:hypothetical protein